MRRIRKGDQVIVLTGRDKGKVGTVLSLPTVDRVVVEGVNIVKKHLFVAVFSHNLFSKSAETSSA